MKKYVIVGGGTAGWFTASALSKQFRNADITLIESLDIPIISVGESVTPHVQAFFDFLDIPTHHWMKETGAVYKLANKFQGWITGDLNEVEYFSFNYATDVKRLYRETSEVINVDGDSTEYKISNNSFKTTDLIHELYNNKAIDKFDKFFHSQYHYMAKNVAPFKDQTYLLNPSYSWSQHINAEKCGEYLKNHIAIPNGVTHIQQKVLDVTFTGDQINSLTLEDGRVVTGDVFIDATGFHKLLVKKLGWKEIPFKDYAIDRAVVGQLDYEDPHSEMVNYTQSIAQPNGWQFKIGLYHRMGSGYCFSSNHISDEQGVDDFLKMTKNRKTEPRLIKWSPSKLEEMAKGNVATVGLSSGFYEPLEANSLYILISGIKHLLMSLKEYEKTNLLDWKQFNEKMTYGIDDIADFIKVHYTLSQRTDTDFWNDMRAIGKRDHHEDLVRQKYFDHKSSMVGVFDHWSMFADFMWMQLALSWNLDTSKWYDKKIDNTTMDIGKDYFIGREHKHDLISNSLPNSYEWLKENVFENQNSSEWFAQYLKNRSNLTDNTKL